MREELLRFSQKVARHLPNPIVWQSLENELAPVRQYFTGKILNAGSGSRSLKDYLTKSGVDGAEQCDLGPGTEPGYFQCNLLNIPRPDATYDSVLCNAVLEHVTDMEAVVKELTRVTKPNGVIVISFPFLQPYHLGPTDFMRLTSEGIHSLGSRHGLEVLSVMPCHGIAQTLGWIAWSVLEERGNFLIMLLLWLPVRLWCLWDNGNPPVWIRQASAFQAAYRKA